MISLNHFKNYIHTDKYADWSSDGPGTGHNYVGMFYDRICSEMKETASAILEIGVLAGHSQLLWSAYFQNARIYGVDVLQPPFPDHNRIRLFHIDGYHEFTPFLMGSLEPKGFDLIVDDGPHTFESQKRFVELYWSLVKLNGYMVIEDIIDWQAIEYFKNRFGNEQHEIHFSPASSGTTPIHAMVVRKTRI